ncbi:lysylphosphatidylglycerol synthase transmembrane domain-containing protein [Fuchsiella alkaliacetigena]|uniref:lysylphosphatidylglycerol synthase transmembrane domain-containing protein n=1 Tax=Fuchsiella alkaliacetigena TaxID=957042 RepID=UPI00200AF4AA|nr:lysylphosphatidylglycerol synthase transmembrane domain-containing protein [Fuchsiella alkaliacetigena]MCK8825270.1 flippase-like domain-containing protein [Fuchsiella alkaliacetigena]
MLGKRVLLWIAGILAISLLVFFTGWEDIKLALAGAEVSLMLVLCLLQLGTLLLGAYQWRYLLQKSTNISLPRVLGINLAGKFIESVTPSSKLGGEAAKVYLFRQYTGLKYQSLTSLLLVHKHITLLPFLVLAGLFLLLTAFRFTLPTVVYFAFFTLVAIFIVLFLFCYRSWQQEGAFEADLSVQKSRSFLKLLINKGRKAISFLEKAATNSQQVLKVKGHCWLLFISLVIWLLYPVKIYLVASMLGFEVSLALVGVITYGAYVVSMLPLLPGGLGSFEASMAVMFSLNGLLSAQGLSIALLSRLVTYWFPLLLSIAASIYLLSENRVSIPGLSNSTS